MFGNFIAKAQRVSTNSPTSNVVLQTKRYSAFKFSCQVPPVQVGQHEQLEACITRTGGDDYYKLDLPTTAAKFWNAVGLQKDINPEDI